MPSHSPWTKSAGLLAPHSRVLAPNRTHRLRRHARPFPRRSLRPLPPVLPRFAGNGEVPRRRHPRLQNRLPRSGLGPRLRGHHSLPQRPTATHGPLHPRKPHAPRPQTRQPGALPACRRHLHPAPHPRRNDPLPLPGIGQPLAPRLACPPPPSNAPEASSATTANAFPVAHGASSAPPTALRLSKPAPQNSKPNARKPCASPNKGPSW